MQFENQQAHPYDRERGEGVPDDYFRAWATESVYKDGIKRAVAEAPDLQAKAAQEESLTRDLHERCGVINQETTVVQLLFNMTYFHCMSEVEKFWPADAPPARTALSDKMTDADRATTSRLAHWIWERRFAKSGYGGLIGGRLLAEVLANATHAEEHKLAIYAGHDYSILSILAALGAPGRYVGPPLSFGAFINFDIFLDAAPEATAPPTAEQVELAAAAARETASEWKSDQAAPPQPMGAGRLKLRVTLNSEPFHTDTGAPTLDVQEHFKFVVVDGLDLGWLAGGAALLRDMSLAGAAQGATEYSDLLTLCGIKKHPSEEVPVTEGAQWARIDHY